jgi:hypothetical protein
MPIGGIINNVVTQDLERKKERRKEGKKICSLSEF